MNETVTYKGWRNPKVCLILFAAAAPFSFAIWMALLNNFTVEVANFTGTEIGTLQSIREIPGLLAFTAIFFLLMIREQLFALISLLVLGIGIAATGFFPTVYGLYLTTLLMSVGFHYMEAVQMSLSLQWLSKEEAPKALSHQVSAKSVAALLAYGMLWLGVEVFDLSYTILYLVAGGATVAITIFIWISFPRIEGHTPQQKSIFLRKRYWLFYALTFMGGARRQIFVVFAGFLLVTKFGYGVGDITGLYLINHLVTTWLAPKLGKLVARWGERRALILEYVGLIIVFISYGLVEDPTIAAGLYVIDHLFFSFAIAQKSYLQKIAADKDIASTSSVSFSINHIAAVFIPILFGIYLWEQNPAMVFYAGAALAFVSLILSLNVPRHPAPGNEVIWGKQKS